jgi:hypothetical protein
MTNGEPLGLPNGSVRALMSLVVVVGAAVVAAFLTVRDPDSDLTKILVGGWGTALGNVIGFYFGARSAQG